MATHRVDVAIGLGMSTLMTEGMTVTEWVADLPDSPVVRGPHADDPLPRAARESSWGHGR